MSNVQGRASQQHSFIERVGKHQWGYNVDQVDEFLRHAHRLYEAEDPKLTQEDIQLTSFDLQKGGYTIGQVDATLIRLERAVVDKHTQWEIANRGNAAWNNDTRALALTLQERAEHDDGTRFRKGMPRHPSYDVKQVDLLVRQAWTRITRLLGLRTSLPEEPDSEQISSSRVANVIFTQRKGHHGYAESSVDAYLNRIIQVLTRCESAMRLGVPLAGASPDEPRSPMAPSFVASGSHTGPYGSSEGADRGRVSYVTPATPGMDGRAGSSGSGSSASAVSHAAQGMGNGFAMPRNVSQGQESTSLADLVSQTAATEADSRGRGSATGFPDGTDSAQEGAATTFKGRIMKSAPLPSSTPEAATPAQGPDSPAPSFVPEERHQHGETAGEGGEPVPPSYAPAPHPAAPRSHPAPEEQVLVQFPFQTRAQSTGQGNHDAPHAPAPAQQSSDGQRTSPTPAVRDTPEPSHESASPTVQASPTRHAAEPDNGVDEDGYLSHLMNTSVAPTGSFDIPALTLSGFENSSKGESSSRAASGPDDRNKDDDPSEGEDGSHK